MDINNIIFIVSWIILCFIIGLVGMNRKIGFAAAFFSSLLLSPIIGLIITVVSKSKSDIDFENKVLENQNIQNENVNNINLISNITDELIKIKNLLDNGVINQDEFNMLKSKLIKQKTSDEVEDSTLDIRASEKNEIMFSNIILPEPIQYKSNKVTYANNITGELIKTSFSAGEEYFFIHDGKRISYRSYENALKGLYKYLTEGVIIEEL